MRRLVSSQNAQAADRDAETLFAYPPAMLMEEAGIRLQDRLEALEAQGAWPQGLVVYLAGPGNNGGDAWVMARHAFLRGRTSVAVVFFDSPATPSNELMARWAAQIGIPQAPWPSAEAEDWLGRASVWVDGLWGTGLREPLRPNRAEMLGRLEALRAKTKKEVVAIDVASGLRDGRGTLEPVLRARWTLTPGPLKDFCFHPSNRTFSGTLIEVPLSFPKPAESSAFLAGEIDLPSLVPRIGLHDHKGKRGHVALMGGASGMTGALVLSAQAAAAAGSGLVSLGVDSELVSLVAPQVPAFQVRPSSEFLALVSRYDSWVVGPGWGRGADRPGLLEAVWASTLPLVLDADGFSAWLSLGRPSRNAPTVFTPHPGEFLRLGAGTEPTVDAAGALAMECGVCIVLKGAVTWILSPDGRRAVWDGLEPALGTGGSGDCLAGVVGAFLAAGLGAYEAALGAVALHGAAGKDLARREGFFTADRLPPVLARIAFACRTSNGPL